MEKQNLFLTLLAIVAILLSGCIEPIHYKYHEGYVTDVDYIPQPLGIDQTIVTFSGGEVFIFNNIEGIPQNILVNITYTDAVYGGRKHFISSEVIK